MSDIEFQEQIEAIRRMKNEALASKEAAVAFQKRIGILDHTGALAEPYRYAMYSSPSSLLLGVHRCERGVGEKVLGGGEVHLLRSENDYHWLGHGIHFWENNPATALQFDPHVLKDMFHHGANIAAPHSVVAAGL